MSESINIHEAKTQLSRVALGEEFTALLNQGMIFKILTLIMGI